jgi:SPP1 family predicted phage head-tail adaptor
MIRAGDLNKRIEIHAPTNVAGEAGGPSETFALLARTWASLRPMKGREAIGPGGVGAEALGTTSVRIRWRLGVTPRCRILYQGRWFEINSVCDLREEHTELDLVATELQ